MRRPARRPLWDAAARLADRTARGDLSLEAAGDTHLDLDHEQIELALERLGWLMHRDPMRAFRIASVLHRSAAHADDGTHHVFVLPLARSGIECALPRDLVDALDDARSYFRETGDRPREFEAQLLRAAVASRLGEQVAARDEYLAVLAETSDDPSSWLAAEACLGIAVTTFRLEHVADARKYCDYAIRRASHAEDVVLWIKATEIMAVLRHCSGEVDAAMQLLGCADKRAASEGLLFRSAVIRMNRAVFALGVSDYEAAYEHCAWVRAYASEHELVALHRLSLSTMANASTCLAHWDEAGRLYAESVDIAESVEDRTGASAIESNWAILCLLLGQREEAQQHVERSLRFARETASSRFEATATMVQGRVHGEFGRSDAATACFRRALSLYLERNGGSDAALCLLELGRHQLEAGDAREAILALEQALQRGRALAGRYIVAEATGLLGVCHAATSHWDLAIPMLRRAVDGALALRNVKSAVQFGTALGEAIERGEADPQAAGRAYERATEGVEFLLGSARHEGERIFFSGLFHMAYEGAVRCALATKRVAHAFELAESSRSRAFVDLIASSGSIRAAKGAGNELAEARRELRDRRIALELGADRGPGDSYTGGQMLDRVRRRVDALIQARRRRDPERAALEHVESCKWSELAASLGSDTGVLAYYTTLDRILIFAGKGGARRLQIHEVPLDRVALFNLVSRCRPPRLLGFDSEEPLRAIAPSSLREAYRVLIEPVEGRFDGCKHLVILPHGVLHEVPFSALLDAQDSYLVERLTHGIAVAPSGTAWLRCRRSPRHGKAPESISLVANPAVGWPSLPGTELELQSIAASFSQSVIARGADADRRAFFRNATDVDVVHFAGHGLHDSDFPMHSSLLLAAPGRRCHDPVTASDLYGLETRAGLVVLGACLSGLHGRRAGDELIGLARAFFHAGTPSLIASLWALDDLATSFLFSRFYDHLCAGMSKSRALAEAQLHVSRISKEDVLDRIRKLQGDATLRADARASLECEKRRIDNTLPAELPYANPTYWAAPTLIGVGF